MEKIIALIDKLQELKHDDQALSELAYYTQLLYAELMCAKNNAGEAEQPARRKVAVIMPGHSQAAMPLGNPAARKTAEPVSRPLHTPETVHEPELESVESYASVEAPVLAEEPFFSAPEPQVTSQPRAASAAKTVRPGQGRELNETIAEHIPSLNDRLKAENVELGAKINSSQHVRDLTKAVGINDKFLFINELFRGDRNMFDRSVKTINDCGSFSEADYWIGRELKIKLGWEESNAVVQQFYALVRKRFC